MHSLLLSGRALNEATCGLLRVSVSQVMCHSDKSHQMEAKFHRLELLCSMGSQCLFCSHLGVEPQPTDLCWLEHSVVFPVSPPPAMGLEQGQVHRWRPLPFTYRSFTSVCTSDACKKSCGDP